MSDEGLTPQKLSQKLYALSNQVALNNDIQISQYSGKLSDLAQDVAQVAIEQRTAQYDEITEQLKEAAAAAKHELDEVNDTIKTVGALSNLVEGITKFLTVFT